VRGQCSNSSTHTIGARPKLLRPSYGKDPRHEGRERHKGLKLSSLAFKQNYAM
jgi:hypothetical protein